MSVYAQFDKDGDSIQVASNTGWSEFGSWAEALTGCPHTRKLWEDSECEDIPALRAEIEEELGLHPPQNADVASVAHEIIYAIDAGQGDGDAPEILLITNGVTT